MTELHIAMKEKDWMLIFTPPYRPQFQPIELVWRHGKGYAASQWSAGRSLKETYEDLCAGWYGGTSRQNGAVLPSAITSQQAQSWIKTAEDFMDAGIVKSRVLFGSVDDLQVNVSVDAVDVYEDPVESHDESDAASDEEEQGD